MHGLDDTIPDARKIFGLATYTYNERNQPVGIEHYSHHGVIMPTALRAWVGLFGPTEATVRSFVLILSLCATVLMYATLARVLRDARIAFLPGLLYVFLPIKLTYLDQMKYEVGAELGLLLCLYALARRPTGAGILFPVAFILLFQTDFAAFAATFLIVVHLFIAGGRTAGKRFAIHAALAGANGRAITMSLQYALGFSPDRIPAPRTIEAATR